MNAGRGPMIAAVVACIEDQFGSLTRQSLTRQSLTKRRVNSLAMLDVGADPIMPPIFAVGGVLAAAP